MISPFLTPMLSWDQSPEYSSGHGKASVLLSSNPQHMACENPDRENQNFAQLRSPLSGDIYNKTKKASSFQPPATQPGRQKQNMASDKKKETELAQLLFCKSINNIALRC